MKVIGYTDKLSVGPTEPLAVMVSSMAPRYRADLVRLIHGVTDPEGPGFKSRRVDCPVSGEHEGRIQEIPRGSYVRVTMNSALKLHGGSFTLQMWIRPTTPTKPLQTLLSAPGYGLRLRGGRLELEVGHDVVAVRTPVIGHTWYFVAATYDIADGVARLVLEPVRGTGLGLGATNSGEMASTSEPDDADLLIAAERNTETRIPFVQHFYNGKIEAPRIYRAALGSAALAQLANGAGPAELPELVAAWDFSVDINSRAVSDVSGQGLEGHTVNMPMRGATGHNWSGRELDWRRAPREYGAIHFHDDDLDDAEWDTDFTWTVPEDLPSGIYAFHLRAAGEEDYVPFVVRPHNDKPRARVVLLVPTFSYLAYANEQLLTRPDLWAEGLSVPYPVHPQDRCIVANRLLSLYDLHSDGSGVCYSSRLRPLLNMRPKYNMPQLNSGEGSPHQLNADLCIVDWLSEHSYEFDVIADDDLHADGADVLAGYNVVITGSHSEYWSEQMLDAAQSYLLGGGRMMYLGGNGMYWVTQLDPEHGHTIEIRRRGPGSRTWEPEPGEAHLSTTGEPGGTWRYRGRSPQTWLGVGFTAAGGDGSARPYARQPQSYDRRSAFIFDGIGENELIGDFPSLVNKQGGAAGFEIDRLDASLGTPHHTLLLATASGFSDGYQVASDDVRVSDSQQGGSVSPLVRADMVFLEYPRGGAVFSTGSIQWAGSLSYNGYDNTVSRVTKNVLDRFISDEPIHPPSNAGSDLAD